MTGIQFVVGDAGQKTAVIIDLKKHKRAWEDFYDGLIAKKRQHEPRLSLDDVKKRLTKAGKL